MLVHSLFLLNRYAAETTAERRPRTSEGLRSELRNFGRGFLDYPGRELAATVKVELTHGAIDMGFDCADRKHKASRDLAVRQAFGDEPGDLRLPTGKLFEVPSDQARPGV